ncbi:hypothetical protein [Janibacter melonis]|uniref:hypothetical protein n=1 Tax=Janibacter melonis TaxID=262209 RepID=UPI00174AEA2C|nr:hypothetical protein [Janibacter melonis]
MGTSGHEHDHDHDEHEHEHQGGGRTRSMTIRRVSLPAFETALAAATGQDVPAPEGAWTELERAELASGGMLRPSWARVLAAAPGAPVQVRVVARQDLVSFESDIALLPGIALVRTQRVRLRATAEGYEPAGREGAVELVAVDPEQLWAAVRRVLPPHEALRAAAHVTPLSRERHLAPPRGVAEDLRRRVEADPLGRTPGAVLESAVDDPELSAVLAGGEAQVAVTVLARTGADVAVPVGSGHWVLADEHLCAVRTASGTPDVVGVEPGDVAAQLRYLVTGAHALVDEAITGQVGA